MLIDCHVHIAACTPGHGLLSDRLLKSFAFRFMQRRFNLHGASLETELELGAHARPKSRRNSRPRRCSRTGL